VIRHATRRGPFNTDGSTARFVFYAQLRRYSRYAFLARKAPRVVRATRGTFCFGQRHTGRDEILLRDFTPRQQKRGGGGGCHNQPRSTGRYEAAVTQSIAYAMYAMFVMHGKNCCLYGQRKGPHKTAYAMFAMLAT